jgi:hypothetical protein
MLRGTRGWTHATTHENVYELQESFLDVAGKGRALVSHLNPTAGPVFLTAGSVNLMTRAIGTDFDGHAGTGGSHNHAISDLGFGETTALVDMQDLCGALSGRDHAAVRGGIGNHPPNFIPDKPLDKSLMVCAQ